MEYPRENDVIHKPRTAIKSVIDIRITSPFAHIAFVSAEGITVRRLLNKPATGDIIAHRRRNLVISAKKCLRNADYAVK